MAATGNEAVRLEQLKGVYPQVVSFSGGSSATITLGNGKVVTFSSSVGSIVRVYLLVRAMYSCFEIVQAVSTTSNTLVTVECDDGMNTFKSKCMSGDSSISYIGKNNVFYDARITYNATTFNITAVSGGSTFIGALIYVE